MKQQFDQLEGAPIVCLAVDLRLLSGQIVLPLLLLLQLSHAARYDNG